MWANELKKRKGIDPDLTPEAQKEYRKRVLDDQRRVKNRFGIHAERVPVGASINNDTGLPPSKRSRLSADIQHWCEFNSWGVCANCGIMLPRSITPQSLTQTLPPEVPSSKCHHCSATRQYFVPNAKDTPEELQRLKSTITEALSPVIINAGPCVRAHGGYRMHSGMMRFSWSPVTVKQSIAQLRGKENRKKARKAYDLF